MLAILPLSIFVVFPKGCYQALLKRAAFILLPAALATLFIIGFKWDVFSEQIAILINYQRPALRLWSEGLVSSFLFQCHPFITLLALYAVLRAYQLKDKRFLLEYWRKISRATDWIVKNRHRPENGLWELREKEHKKRAKRKAWKLLR